MHLSSRGTLASAVVRVAAMCCTLFLVSPSSFAHGSQAHEQLSPAEVRATTFGVSGELPPPTADTAELKFRDFYRMPVGPRGLEPTDKLLALDGKRVRIVGYMAQRELPTAGAFILAPVPVEMAEDEDGPADDLPPAILFVHLDNLPGAATKLVPYMPGLLQFTGTLSVGAKEEADTRISNVRLLLDAPSTQAVLNLRSTAVAAHR